MRHAPALLICMAVAALATPGAAQTAAPGQKPPAAARPAARPDPALAETAQKLAGPYRLMSADGTRACPVALKPTAVSASAFALEIAAGACAAIPFAAEAMAWAPDPSGSIRLRAGDGRLLAEFTEATGGTYEALREGDGVYFLATPAAVAIPEVSAEEMLGDWALVRATGASPLCRWTLTDTPVAPASGRPGGFAITGDRTCPGIGDFIAAIWRIEGGNVVVTPASGSQVLRFTRQEDGSWAKTPERGRPLFLARP